MADVERFGDSEMSSLSPRNFLELCDRRPKILRRRALDRHLSSVRMLEPQFFGVQREAGDQRTLLFAAGGAVVALERAEEQPRRERGVWVHRGVVQRIDDQRQADVREVHADLM